MPDPRRGADHVELHRVASRQAQPSEPQPVVPRDRGGALERRVRQRWGGVPRREVAGAASRAVGCCRPALAQALAELRDPPVFEVGGAIALGERVAHSHHRDRLVVALGDGGVERRTELVVRRVIFGAHVEATVQGAVGDVDDVALLVLRVGCPEPPGAVAGLARAQRGTHTGPCPEAEHEGAHGLAGDRRRRAGRCRPGSRW